MAARRNPGETIESVTRNAAEQPLNRRRALRVLSALAVAAAGAAVVSASRPEKVSADTQSYTDTQSGAVLSATNNGTGAAMSALNTVSSPISGSPGMVGESYNGIGVYGISLNDNYGGVYGQNNANGPGVYGTVVGSGPGVYGSAGNTGVKGSGNIGVYGVSSGLIGVYGDHTAGGIAVLGQTTSSSNAAVEGDNPASGPGVFGNCTVGTGSGTGVKGASESGTGVAGISSSGTGVLGASFGSIGVSGTTNTAAGGSPAVQGVNFGGGGPGVVGFSGTGTGVGGGTASGIGFGGVADTGNGVQGQTTSGIAVEGIATGASGFSAYFTGGQGAAINGNLTVMGKSYKSAAVPGKDGTLVRLYCVESPECWFEDFGRAQLSNGSTTVQLEPGFGGVVKTDDYHVFLTPHGETNGLYVTNQTPSSFAVHEGHGGSSTVSFSYRIVAKRKDVTGTRLEHVDEPPAVHLLTLPELPATPPTPPTPPTPQVPTPPGHGG
jgi:hypothetical protein